MENITLKDVVDYINKDSEDVLDGIFKKIYSDKQLYYKVFNAINENKKFEYNIKNIEELFENIKKSEMERRENVFRIRRGFGESDEQIAEAFGNDLYCMAVYIAEKR